MAKAKKKSGPSKAEKKRQIDQALIMIRDLAHDIIGAGGDVNEGITNPFQLIHLAAEITQLEVEEELGVCLDCGGCRHQHEENVPDNVVPISGDIH